MTNIIEALYQFDSRTYLGGMDRHEIRLRNLKHLMAQEKMTRRELAAKIDTDYGQVGHWFLPRENRGYRNIGDRKCQEIEDAFGLGRGWMDTPQWLEAGESKPPLTREVPVVGFAIATPDEDGFFEDFVYPPGARAYITWDTTDRDAYALEVKGDSMVPRVKPGEFLVVEPHAKVSPGDEIVARTVSGRRMFKEFLYERSGQVTLGSVNQAYRAITIARDEVISMHRAHPARGARVREAT